MTDREMLIKAIECLNGIKSDVDYDSFPEFPNEGCRRDRINTKYFNFMHSPEVQVFITMQRAKAIREKIEKDVNEYRYRIYRI